MLVTIVEGGLVALGVYLAAGVLFAVPFLLNGAGRIDQDAAGGSRGFKLLVFPGVVALWPLLVGPWRRSRQRTERSPHRDAAIAGDRR
ncbi:hypothetical protein Pla86_04940 [Planctomycetes bacterium Pla86]|uniref:Uncharacterized protein n=1 Tax=Engelhardtia mirabilis TaxID=2528011 RepID=A0A518BEL0_9BACT|nr:hypothetical protein Pla133_04940 [Planctomycetes bacterium Pla133]QDU99755.1 hypothetical protein Pla86_04940 [Planctomycetes bacterium Pla86]